jgi:hypothetical protein
MLFINPKIAFIEIKRRAFVREKLPFSPYLLRRLAGASESSLYGQQNIKSLCHAEFISASRLYSTHNDTYIF